MFDSPVPETDAPIKYLPLQEQTLRQLDRSDRAASEIAAFFGRVDWR